MNDSEFDNDWFFLKKKVKKNEWLLSYLDVFVLLLAFFLILASITTNPMDDSKTGFRSITEGYEPVITPIWELKEDLETDLLEEIEAGILTLQPEYNEIRLTFNDAYFYETGSAYLLDDGKAIIERIVNSLSSLKFYEYYIDVEGHTDDRSIQTLRYPSNWELSTARAAGIIRYFIEQGLPPHKLKASGYAEMHPLAPNRDEFGVPIVENMARNRRVVIRIFYELGTISSSFIGE
jgi:chemotaxis protein MotB